MRKGDRDGGVRTFLSAFWVLFFPVIRQGAVGSKIMPVFQHSEKKNVILVALGIELAEDTALSQTACLAFGLHCLLRKLGQVIYIP